MQYPYVVALAKCRDCTLDELKALEPDAGMEDEGAGCIRRPEKQFELGVFFFGQRENESPCYINICMDYHLTTSVLLVGFVYNQWAWLTMVVSQTVLFL
ncbi:hypothetical protein Hanom_Chr16g01494571 [Helianthus anomalus]